MRELSPELQNSRVFAEALSFKLWRLDQFKANWEALIPHRLAMFQIYGHRSLTNNKFWSYTRKQQCLAQMAKDMFPTKNTVLAFGNGLFPPSQKGAPPGPSVSLARYLSKRGRVVMVDEFRTSVVCNKCKHRLTKAPITTRILRSVWEKRRQRQEEVEEDEEEAVQDDDKEEEDEAYENEHNECGGFNYQWRNKATWKRTRKKNAHPNQFDPAFYVEKKAKVHAVLRCQHCSETHGADVFKNRDVNAALNMRDLLVWRLRGEERHPSFRRDTELSD